MAKRPPNAPPKTPEEIDADNEIIARAAERAGKAGAQLPQLNPRTVAAAGEARELNGRIARATGKRYNIDILDLTLPSIRELNRLIRDLTDERDDAVREARRG